MPALRTAALSGQSITANHCPLSAQLAQSSAARCQPRLLHSARTRVCHARQFRKSLLLRIGRLVRSGHSQSICNMPDFLSKLRPDNQARARLVRRTDSFCATLHARRCLGSPPHAPSRKVQFLQKHLLVTGLTQMVHSAHLAYVRAMFQSVHSAGPIGAAQVQVSQQVCVRHHGR